MSFRNTFVPSAVVAERLGAEVDVDATCERVGHHQRRAREVVRPHVGAHAALEIAVAAEHADRDQVAVANRCADRVRAAARCCRCRSCSRNPPR